MDASSTSKRDLEFSNRHACPPPASYLTPAATDKLRLVGREPIRGWPAYPVLVPDGNPTEVIRDPVFNPENFWNAAGNDGWATGNETDLRVTALKAAQAVAVDPREFRAFGENACLLRPLVGRGFQVWELKNRAARDGKMRHNGRLGARLVSNASGLFSQMVSVLNATHPVIRTAGFREVMGVLRSPGQVGYLPIIATDAQLGFSVMARQSAEVLFDPHEGDCHFLVRPTGACARAHQGSQGALTQRAKVGHCPC